MATPPVGAPLTADQILEWARPDVGAPNGHTIGEADRAMAEHFARCTSLYQWLQASMSQGKRGVDGLAYTAAVEDARQTYHRQLWPAYDQPRDAWLKPPRKVSA